MHSLSASCPACPNGVCPRSWARQIASDELLVELQRTRDRARDLRHFQRMREAGAVQVSLVIDEHLGLVDQPPERGRMHDTVAVALELAARRRAAAPAWRRPRDCASCAA